MNAFVALISTPLDEYMTKYLNIDTDECRRFGKCADMCSNAFDFDENTMKAKVVNEPSAGKDEIEDLIRQRERG
jgi:ferredoxin